MVVLTGAEDNGAGRNSRVNAGGGVGLPARYAAALQGGEARLGGAR